jgi:hypothetical protein
MKQKNSLALILKNANNISRECQKISSKSKIYTVCKMEHAEGLLAQTLPAFEVGADIDIEEFNAYKFCKKITSYTHAHLTSNHAKAIRLTKSFENINLKGIWIAYGSEPVEWDLIIDFIKKGCNFMVNLRMTEIGPCTINTVFKNLESVLEYKKRAINRTLIGDKTHCDTKIENGTLHVKSAISVFKDEWFDTKDIVALNKNKEFYIQGRSK